MNFSVNSGNLSIKSRTDSCSNLTGNSLFYTVIAVGDIAVGLPANVWIVCLFITAKGSFGKSDIFMFNLSFSELFTCLFILIKLLSDYYLGHFLKISVVNFLHGFVLAGRPLFQCCICVDRYLAVVHPIIYFKYKALSYRLMFLSFLWITIITISAVNSSSNFFSVFIVIFVLVLATNSFCSLSILRALRQPQPGGGDKGMNSMKRKAFKTVLLIQLLITFNYLPMIIYISKQTQFSTMSFYCELGTIFFTFLVFGSSVHSILYLSKVRRLPCSKYN